MMNFSRNPTDILLDFEGLSGELIPLNPDKIEQAARLSEQILSYQKKWQVYLNALALFGFEQWLKEREPKLFINLAHCTILQPHYANILPAVSLLEVGQFKLCLIGSGSIFDEVVTLPRVVVDLPEYAAHFYLLVTVEEEQEQVQIGKFISYTELQKNLQGTNLKADSDWTYELPLTWFEEETERLLLYLRCLDPSTIPLPAKSKNELTSLSQLERELVNLIPQLESEENELWQVISWEQGEILFKSPKLIEWLYQLQMEHPSTHQNLTQYTAQLSQIVQSLAQPIINVGLWLQDEIDELTQSLSWVLLPSPVFAVSSLRSSPLTPGTSAYEMATAIITQLKRIGIEIPAEVRGAYRNLNLENFPLRLYALTWIIFENDPPSEWTLLLILGSQSGENMPQGLNLQVRENDNLLIEQGVNTLNQTYLYTRVIGTWDEQFIITIALTTGESLTLPPFAFIPEFAS